ncbi:hypothetical protein TNCV_1146351 [Trichonephila clavipes]|nr:hypothetical protein TNCV_1146351 [Trichonephila clavipes]
MYWDMHRRCRKYDWASFRNCCKGEQCWPLSHFICTLHYTSRTTYREKMFQEKHEVLSNVIEIIKEIRPKALNSRIFEAICEEMGSEYTHLRHAEVRWLSRGKILT